MYGWFGDFLIGCGSLFLGGACLLYYYQDKLLYYPYLPSGRTQFLSPASYNLAHCLEEVWLRTPDGLKLEGWLFKQETNSSSIPTILFFQENAGNISHRLPNIQQFKQYLRCNIFILSYRGYGHSEGYPTEAGMKVDAETALDYLLHRDDLDRTKIIVFGRSLGGAVALHLCSNAESQSKVRGLIIENTFTSVPDMIDVVFPLLSRFKFLCTNVWESIGVISKIRIPLLMLASEKDELVPLSHMRRLQEAAVNALHKEFYSFPEGHHMDAWLQPGYVQKLRTFIEQNTMSSQL